MAGLGTLQDNDKNSFKIVSENGSNEIARRVDISSSSFITGTTKAYTGTATTSASDIPSAAGNAIKEVLISNLSTTISLQVSFDGGLTYFPIPASGILVADPVRGPITQFKIKSAASTVNYSALVGCI